MLSRPGDLVRLRDAHVAQANRQYIGSEAIVREYRGGGRGKVKWYEVEVYSEGKWKPIKWRATGMEEL
jgi:hypothetical protein